jgi:hypothetical protein
MSPQALGNYSSGIDDQNEGTAFAGKNITIN